MCITVKHMYYNSHTHCDGCPPPASPMIDTDVVGLSLWATIRIW